MTVNERERARIDVDGLGRRGFKGSRGFKGCRGFKGSRELGST